LPASTVANEGLANDTWLFRNRLLDEIGSKLQARLLLIVRSTKQAKIVGGRRSTG